MDSKDILIQVLIAQRNTALDALAQVQAQLVELQRKVAGEADKC